MARISSLFRTKSFCVLFSLQSGTVMSVLVLSALTITSILNTLYILVVTSSFNDMVVPFCVSYFYLIVLEIGLIIGFIGAFKESSKCMLTAAIFVAISLIIYFVIALLSFFPAFIDQVCFGARCPEHLWLTQSYWRVYQYQQNYNKTPTTLIVERDYLDRQETTDENPFTVPAIKILEGCMVPDEPSLWRKALKWGRDMASKISGSEREPQLLYRRAGKPLTNDADDDPDIGEEKKDDNPANPYNPYIPYQDKGEDEDEPKDKDDKPKKDENPKKDDKPKNDEKGETPKDVEKDTPKDEEKEAEKEGEKPKDKEKEAEKEDEERQFYDYPNVRAETTTAAQSGNNTTDVKMDGRYTFSVIMTIIFFICYIAFLGYVFYGFMAFSVELKEDMYGFE